MYRGNILKSGKTNILAVLHMEKKLANKIFFALMSSSKSCFKIKLHCIFPNSIVTSIKGALCKLLQSKSPYIHFDFDVTIYFLFSLQNKL